MIYANATVQLTPAMMAEAFWQLGSDKQVEFFDELARVIRQDNKTNSSAYSLGELQWFYVGDKLLKRKNDDARSMLMTMAAPLYLNTLRARNDRLEREAAQPAKCWGLYFVARAIEAKLKDKNT